MPPTAPALDVATVVLPDVDAEACQIAGAFGTLRLFRATMYDDIRSWLHLPDGLLVQIPNRAPLGLRWQLASACARRAERTGDFFSRMLHGDNHAGFRCPMVGTVWTPAADVASLAVQVLLQPPPAALDAEFDAMLERLLTDVDRDAVIHHAQVLFDFWEAPRPDPPRNVTHWRYVRSLPGFAERHAALCTALGPTLGQSPFRFGDVDQLRTLLTYAGRAPGFRRR